MIYVSDPTPYRDNKSRKGQQWWRLKELLCLESGFSLFHVHGKKGALPQVEAFSAELPWLMFGIKDRRKKRLEGHTILMPRAHYEFPHYHDYDNLHSVPYSLPKNMPGLPPADLCHCLAEA